MLKGSTIKIAMVLGALGFNSDLSPPNFAEVA